MHLVEPDWPTYYAMVWKAKRRAELLRREIGAGRFVARDVMKRQTSNRTGRMRSSDEAGEAT